MTTQFEKTLELSSARLLADPRLATWTGCKLKIWLFNDLATRQSLKTALNERGIEAEVHSAYKPLLHFFLDEPHSNDLKYIEIRYPVHAAAAKNRFLLEAYPLARLLHGKALRWIAQEQQDSLDPLHYVVRLTNHSGQTSEHFVEAPNQLFVDQLQQTSLCPTGLLSVTNSQTGALVQREFFQTEIQLAYREVLHWVANYPWGHTEPYFERLVIRIDLPGAECLDSSGVMMSSTLEALHEDLYFSILEFFQHHSGRPAGDRGLQPGQIVPDIRMGSDCVRIKISLFNQGEELPGLNHVQDQQLNTANVFAGASSFAALETLDRPLRAEDVDALLEKIDGNIFESCSRQARVLKGLVRKGSHAALVLTGGQHANEPSGVVGALRAGHWLASIPQAHFALVPLENPDGYQLYREYCTLHTQHLHHAARYTGLGDDLEYREHAPWYETEARRHAVTATGAQLHMSLHGYPAHEWTRPFTGYIPRGFDLWSIPKGFFLIVRYQSAYRPQAYAWLETITTQIAGIPGLSEFNAEQLEVYATHAGGVPFEIHHGIACLMVQNDAQPTGIKLVTEFPDETISGASFQFAQQVQTETVRIASEAWWALNQQA